MISFGLVTHGQRPEYASSFVVKLEKRRMDNKVADGEKRTA
jgi:hypothetical protein